MSNGQPPRSNSRFIPQEEIDNSTVVRWRFGAVDTPGDAFKSMQAAAFIPAGSPQFNGFSPSITHQPQPQAQPEAEVVEQPSAEPAIDEEQLQQLLEQAREEGHAQGLAEGRAQAQQQWQQRMDDHISGEGRESVRRVNSVLQGLEDNFKQMQSATAQELLNLACDIARQVVRQELACKPEALLPVVREALDMLVTEGRAVTVRLNPVDWEVLDAPLRAEHGAAGKVQWLADASVHAGDVRVDSGGAVIEAGLDSRWRRAVAALGLVSSWYEGGHAE